MVNSKKKGSRSELEACNAFKAHGYDAERTQQYCGNAGDSDIEVKDLDGLFIEVKNVQRLNVANAMTKAKEQCGNRIPIIMHKKDRKPWLVTMDFHDWLRLVDGGREVLTLAGQPLPLVLPENE